jgi:hypothetical protein
MPRKKSPHAKPTGPEMLAYLNSAGIAAQKVVCRRRNKHYVAEFYVPEMRQPVRPAGEWAREIARHGLEIIAAEDTVADWRPGRPVICATVTFTLPG